MASFKATSEVIAVSATVTETAPNVLTSTQIQFPLSPLDNEIFIILQVDMDPDDPELIANTATTCAATLSVVPRTTIGNMGDSNVVAASIKRVRAAAGLTCAVQFNDSNPDGTSPGMKYLAVLATDDMFLNLQGGNNVGVTSAHCRIFGYRAKATSAIYAALVQSELLS